MPKGIYPRTGFSEEHRRNLSLSHIGKLGYWTGKKRSEEDKEKFRVSHLGKKQSQETILKRIPTGSNHYNWQGGITPLIRRRTRGMFWKSIADDVRKRDNNTCLLCQFNGNGNKLPVHHIIPYKISRDNNPFNLATLCQSCHIKQEYVYYNEPENRGYWQEFFERLIAKIYARKGGDGV